MRNLPANAQVAMRSWVKIGAEEPEAGPRVFKADATGELRERLGDPGTRGMAYVLRTELPYAGQTLNHSATFGPI